MKPSHDSVKQVLTDLRFWYLEFPKLSPPEPGPMMVERSEPLSSGFSGPPTRDGSLFAFSLLKVLHSDPTSITLYRNKSI